MNRNSYYNVFLYIPVNLRGAMQNGNVETREGT